MPSITQRFKLLDQSLLQTQSLWRIDPFQCSADALLPWQTQHPQLCSYLESLSAEQVHDFKKDTASLIKALTPFIPELSEIWQVCELPSLEKNMSDNLSSASTLNVGIPGRKWQQICAMTSAVLQLDKTQTNQIHDKQWLEWCAGKGYLGQLLAHQSDLPVISFEWQQALCDAGQALAHKHQLDMRFIQGDALSNDCVSIFQLNQHAVALHACGDLHAQLIEHGCQHSLAALSISPCCYHLTQHPHYQALSNLGINSQLKLTKNELRIPLQETVTGGERVRLHRELEMTYRLGFDSLLQEKMGVKGYTPIPSIKKSMLSLGFANFCLWAAEQKSLCFANERLPDQAFEPWLERGQQRFIHMERMSLVQQVFRRPLEIWLVCDKALRLAQHGYQVSITTFCAREITPRNILIQASK